MSNYTPDNWVILKLRVNDDHFYKVLGGWSGGYLDGDSWRMNSGISKVEENGDFLDFYGYSGSVYSCHKKGYGLRMNNSGVYNQLKAAYGDGVLLMPEDTDWNSIEW